MKHIKRSFQYGEQVITLETGNIARQTTGAVLVSMGDTTVLVTVVAERESTEKRDFFPLTVNYQERYYANGRLPGGFIKREGRPSVQETLVSRLIDRSLRPLFPNGFANKIQVVATLMSLDPEILPDIPSLIGAAAAIEISGVPFNGPLAGGRVGYQNGNYLLNPKASQLKNSKLDLIVAGTETAILMVESEAKELSENDMLGAVMFGHKEMQTAIKNIQDFAQDVNNHKWFFTPVAVHQEFIIKIKNAVEDDLLTAYKITDKQLRVAKLEEIRKKAKDLFDVTDSDDDRERIVNVIFELERQIVRDRILSGFSRIDGRDNKTVRSIDIDLGILPRAHGSALFTRGETQAFVVTTLGTENDAQIIDIPAGESKESFMLHYNFPPYSTGEIGIVGSPKRREIGHGNLAKRALAAVIPSKEMFPYVIRVVSEITESNGSSSMASVCGASLSLMDAGVPLKSPVAGIAMGLIKNEDRFAILTDILGDEDHLGDMDFKVAGTETGITALQMDIKIDGITEKIMQLALSQAKDARMHILGLMHAKIAAPRECISDFAPRITMLKINPEKIRDVIGKGGVVIRSLVEETGAIIDIKDDGTVMIASADKDRAAEAKRRIELLTAMPEIGKVYIGKVTKIMDFGAIVAFLPNKSGMVHISQISSDRVKNVRDYLEEGQEVKVKVVEIDRIGKIRLSIKEVIV
ncbi:MAG: polyribonucleotide nucleotidyltransferase [Coxiellaceae bacterium]|jgi:polyribonucleotide nucleotidyltransferase|nr:polyribonucleotide nucleotidyltransferase [Coxiellaceae bacterium]